MQGMIFQLVHLGSPCSSVDEEIVALRKESFVRTLQAKTGLFGQQVETDLPFISTGVAPDMADQTMCMTL
jgi:hypothetical protein